MSDSSMEFLANWEQNIKSGENSRRSLREVNTTRKLLRLLEIDIEQLDIGMMSYGSGDRYSDLKKKAGVRKEILPNFFMVRDEEETERHLRGSQIPFDFLVENNPNKLARFIEMGGLISDKTIRYLIPRLDAKDQVKVAKIIFDAFPKEALVMSPYDLRRSNQGHVKYLPNGVLGKEYIGEGPFLYGAYNKEDLDGSGFLPWREFVLARDNPMKNILATNNDELIDLCIKNGGDVRELS